MSLKSLPPEERPRERLARYGSEGLSAIELLAILLGSGTQKRSVLELASDLLSHFRTIKHLSEATLSELREVKGIGEAKAIQLQAAFGLMRRVESKPQKQLLDSPQKVYELIRNELEGRKIEMLMVILRDVRKIGFHREIISTGTLTELLLHPREIFHLAIRHRAHSLILAHNHPSGDPTPSTRDLEITNLLVSTGKLVGIELSDHLIVGAESFVSFYNKKIFSRSQY
jgi:DNA repair protein RadC